MHFARYIEDTDIQGGVEAECFSSYFFQLSVGGCLEVIIKLNPVELEMGLGRAWQKLLNEWLHLVACQVFYYNL